MKRPDVGTLPGGKYIVNGRAVHVDYDFPAAAEECGWSLTRVQRRARIERDEHGRKYLARETVHLARRPWRRSAYVGPDWLSARDCAHRGTDGTVDCPNPMCGVTVSDFIRYAAEYLDSLL